MSSGLLIWGLYNPTTENEVVVDEPKVEWVEVTEVTETVEPKQEVVQETVEEPIKEKIEEPIKEEVKVKPKKETNTSQNVEIAPEIEPQSKNEVEVSNFTSNKKTFRVTAYCPCSKCNGKWANGITATGVTAQANHTIAVDPKVIPYGTVVRMNGIDYVAEDCGGAIKGNRIDIYFDTHAEAMAFGVQYLEGEIIS